MADINDRLQRLSRRDELTRRVLQHRALPVEVAGVGSDFVDVVEAVSAVVRRHPGMSVMLAPGDGRPGSAVNRITERGGDVEIAVVAAPSAGTDRAARRAGPLSARPGEAAASAPVGPRDDDLLASHRGSTTDVSTPVWRPPRAWPPDVAEQEYGGDAAAGWRWSG
jgi:hypothetical protein